MAAGIPAKSPNEHDDGTEDDDGTVDDEVKAVKYNYSIFHLMMSMAAMYIAMMLTGWYTMSGTDDNLVLDRSFASVSSQPSLHAMVFWTTV